MRSYSILANYYDALFVDEESVNLWADFTCLHKKKGNMLEIAAGSGAISEELIKRGIDLTISDLSMDMLQIAKEKLGERVPMYTLDMRNFRLEQKFDNVICFNDSLNYLLEEEEILSCFHCVYEALNEGGVFLFDMHQLSRLEEFSEEYVEEGEVKDAEYQWTIVSDDDYLCHHLTFWNAAGEMSEEHIQRVYSSEMIRECLRKSGFTYEVYTDFIKKEEEDGEKWYFVARKGNLC